MQNLSGVAPRLGNHFSNLTERGNMSHIGNDMFMENAYLDGLEEGEKLGLSGEELEKFADKYAKYIQTITIQVNV